jgi:hypothetical protein
MQGYLISKPLPLDDLERLFASTLKTRKERYDLEQSQKR